MSAPTVKVLVGFQTTTGFATPFQLDNATYGLLNTGTLGGFQFVDLTALVLSASTNRGRNRELEQFTAGTATVRFRDPSRVLDPLNTASPYYPNVVPRCPVEIYVAGVVVYSGYVTDWDTDYSIAPGGCVVTALCSDAFTVLANQNLNAWTPSEQSSSARVAAVLTRPEIVYQGPYAVSAGSSTLGAYAVTDGTNALSYLMAVTESEQGELYVDAAGTLTFMGRTEALDRPAGAAFVDAGTGLRYQTLTNAFGDELLYNYVVTQSPAGAAQVTSSATSIALYQSQTLSKTALLNSTTTEVANLGNYLLGRYSEPVLRFTGVTTQLSGLGSADVAILLDLDLTDSASVMKSFTTGTPATSTQQLLVSGIAHTISPGSHTLTFTFESSDQNSYLRLNDAVFGTLDNNLLAF